MNGSSIFTLMLTVIVVVVVAEVLANDYGGETEGPEAQADVMAAVDGSGAGGNAIRFGLEDFNLGSTGDSDADVIEPVEEVADLSDENLKLSFGLMQAVGFENVTLQRVPFNGIMFERVDLRDFKSVPVLRQNLLHDNRSKIAEFYELHADNSLLANEIYLLLQEKSEGIMGGSVNETNELGEKSFYINYSDRPGNAFLVVLKGESVYALTYEKGLHSFVTSLIGQLT